MKITRFFGWMVMSVVIAWLMVSCNASTNQKPVDAENWVWMDWQGDFSGKEWSRKFKELAKLGFHGIHLRQDDPQKMADVAPLAKKAGLEIHAWIIVMNIRSREVKEAHPDWFTVSREGKSSLDHPPYVGYYSWLCPTKEPVQTYLKEWAGAMAGVPGLDGVHLDYIRHCDVILPINLWEKYDIVQDQEYPPYDFCYCDDCRRTFEAQTGIDPMALEDPPSNKEWIQFRYDGITGVVSTIASEVHARGKKLSAAVFPTPDIARTLVRQDWTTWELDMVFPMIYHSFYREDVDWIGTATGEGVQTLDGAFPLYSGLFVPALSPDELARAIQVSIDNGAQGVTIFAERSMSKKHRKVMAKICNK